MIFVSLIFAQNLVFGILSLIYFVCSFSYVCSPMRAEIFFFFFWGGGGGGGWSGGAKVLGKLPVPGRPTNLDYSRARACCACSRCGWGFFGHFF